jgi:hypothetical protein
MIMKTSTLSRRTLLRGMAGGVGVGLALPTLEAMLDGSGKAYADGASLPKRFVIWFWGNGNEPSTWTPSTTGAGWAPTAMQQGLAALTADISVITGLHLPVKGANNPHVEGVVGMLTGGNPVLHPSYTGAQFDWDYMDVPSASIDQLVAQAFAGKTPYRSLEVGATQPHRSNGPGTAISFISHNASYNPNPPELDPAAVFTRLFANGMTAPQGTIDPMLKLRARLLDAVKADAAALRTRLGTSDKQRLDAHLEGISALEQRIKALPPPPSMTCSMPPAPSAPATVSERAQLMGQLVAMALACGLTRVVTFQFSSAASHERYEAWPTDLSCGGTPKDFHEYEHCAGFDDQVRGVLKYFMDRFGTFVQTLKDTPDGAGSLLDNCCVLGTSELGAGPTHEFDNIPLLIAGRAGGALKSGLHVPAPGELPSRVMLALLNAVGVNASTFGTDQLATSSPLTDILV